MRLSWFMWFLSGLLEANGCSVDERPMARTQRSTPRVDPLEQKYRRKNELEDYEVDRGKEGVMTKGSDKNSIIDLNDGRYAASSRIHFYNTYKEIVNYLRKLAAKQSHVKVVELGKTHEKRTMILLRIQKAGKGKPNVFFEHGIHAREWISPAVAIYLIFNFLEGRRKRETETFLNKLNFHILPVANPDGYAYTMTKDRMWRKNRSPNKNSSCIGTDLNRNFNFQWGNGSSPLECEENYRGDAPFSELETRHIRDYIQKLTPKPIFTMSFHSWGQTWMYPYGHDKVTLPENAQELIDISKQAVKAIKRVRGSKYNISKTGVFEAAGGASDDYYAGVLGARFPFTVELPDQGDTEFRLPAEEIVPSGQEVWEGIKVVLNKVIQVMEKEEEEREDNE